MVSVSGVNYGFLANIDPGKKVFSTFYRICMELHLLNRSILFCGNQLDVFIYFPFIWGFLFCF